MGKFAAVAPVFSALSSVAGVLGVLKGEKKPKLPEAKVPTPPNPIQSNDIGQNISLGDKDIKNQRVSGRSVARKPTQSNDILGNLGSSGLNI